MVSTLRFAHRTLIHFWKLIRMIKKLIFILFLFFIHTVYAHTCPTVADIKSNRLHGWEIYNINNSEPLNPEQKAIFKQRAAKFISANWIQDEDEHPGECFYDSAVHDEEYLGAFVAKNVGEPDKSAGNWHELCFNVMQCDASIESCRFKEL
jgi:hypothetical protein